jgi:hypothetical protein
MGSSYFLISNLLLDKLYDRLGMNPVSEQHLILSKENAIKLD